MSRTLRWVGGTPARTSVRTPIRYTVEIERWSSGEENWIADDVVEAPGFRPEDAANAVAEVRGLYFLSYLVNGRQVPRLVARAVNNADYCFTVKQDGITRLIRFYATEEPEA